MDIPLYTEEEMRSDFYRFRNNRSEPKRLKFFVFSTIKPATDLSDYYNKRIAEDSQFCLRDVDFKYLKDSFIDQFASKPGSEDHLDIYQNRLESELWEDIDDLKNDVSLNWYDCFVFIFLTYISPTNYENGNTKIHFYDKMVALDQIWDKVGEIPLMVGKPKLFLVQADDVRLMQEPQMIMKSGAFGTVRRKIPTDADRLSITCTIPGRYFVEGNEPSFFLRAFVEAVNESSEEPLDLLTLTVVINQKLLELLQISNVLKTRRQADLLPMPCATSTLRKLLVI